MSVTVNGSTGLTFNDGTSQSTSAFYGGLALRNRIINGAMMIDQRNAGAAVTVNADASFYPADRFLIVGENSDGVFTAQQDSTVPAGFNKSVKLTVTTTDTSLGASQRYFFGQNIEGFNIADLGWGTASAAPVTLSFWVRSSVTGVFSGSLANANYNRCYPFSYTISAANTWEQKSVTIAGDTTGSWNSTNGVGIRAWFTIGAGSSNLGTAGSWGSTYYFGATGTTNLMATSGATFYITGMQLEKGSTATSFDYRPYGTELALCQRYCYVNRYAGNAYTRFGTTINSATNETLVFFPLPVTMRVIPTFTWSGAFADFAGNSGTSASITSDGNSLNSVSTVFVFSSGTVTNNALNTIRTNNSTTWFARFESEL